MSCHCPPLSCCCRCIRCARRLPPHSLILSCEQASCDNTTDCLSFLFSTLTHVFGHQLSVCERSLSRTSLLNNKLVKSRRGSTGSVSSSLSGDASSEASTGVNSDKSCVKKGKNTSSSATGKRGPSSSSSTTSAGKKRKDCWSHRPHHRLAPLTQPVKQWLWATRTSNPCFSSAYTER